MAYAKARAYSLLLRISFMVFFSSFFSSGLMGFSRPSVPAFSLL